MVGDIRIGTAAWSIPGAHNAAFPGEGSHLQRYARLLNAVEINSSFYRPHQFKTYRRWADNVPPDFRFSVKMPREISHERRLVDVEAPIQRFIGEAEGLGDRLGPLLLQLPPSLRYDHDTARSCFDPLRRRFAGPVVCEPRHASWFTDDVDQLLHSFRIGRVAADPAPVPRAAEPGGSLGITYRRLHGSPRIYYSEYPGPCLAELAQTLRSPGAQAATQWCIFDNTALGEATKNALSLSARVQPQSSPPSGASPDR